MSKLPLTDCRHQGERAPFVVSALPTSPKCGGTETFVAGRAAESCWPSGANVPCDVFAGITRGETGACPPPDRLWPSVCSACMPCQRHHENQTLNIGMRVSHEEE